MSETFTADDIETAATESVATPDASSASETSTESASPTASASVPEVDPIHDPGWGKIPESRRQSILANARTKAAAEREASLNAEWESKAGWAKDIDKDDAAIVQQWLQQGKTDPSGLVIGMLNRIAQDPTHGPKVRSAAAALLGSQRTPAQAAEQDPMPEPDIPTDTSNGVPVVYSVAAQKKLWDWQQRQTKALLQAELAPYQEDRTRAQHVQQLVEMKASAETWASSTMKDITKWPQFAEHKDAIAAAYAALPVVRDPQTGMMIPDPRDPRTEGEKLRDLYAQIVVPKLSLAGAQQAVTSLNRKAQASTVNPASASSTEPFDHKTATWEESLQHEWNKRKNG